MRLIFRKGLWLKVVKVVREHDIRRWSGQFYTQVLQFASRKDQKVFKDIERRRRARLVPRAGPWTDDSPQALLLHVKLTPYCAITTNNSPSRRKYLCLASFTWGDCSPSRGAGSWELSIARGPSRSRVLLLNKSKNATCKILIL